MTTAPPRAFVAPYYVEDSTERLWGAWCSLCDAHSGHRDEASAAAAANRYADEHDAQRMTPTTKETRCPRP